MLDLQAPTAATSIRVWNDGSRPVNVQVRIFQWRQDGNEDVFTSTRNVVASPPITKLLPGAENLVRVIRTAKSPVIGEESYRLVVDELPDPAKARGGTVRFVVRHSIPVFFAAAGANSPQVEWSARPSRGGYIITAHNNGQKRQKVSNLVLRRDNAILARRDGLVGYALGGSRVSWFIAGTGGAARGGSATISADGEAGRFDATVQIATN